MCTLSQCLLYTHYFYYFYSLILLRRLYMYVSYACMMVVDVFSSRVRVICREIHTPVIFHLEYLMFRGLKQLAPRVQMRTKVGYVPPGGRSALKKRSSRPLRSEDVRPAIYYKFDQTVELSDGSTIIRKSVYPRVEWRMLQDQRNSSLWNPSKPDHKALLAGESGKLAKFRRKFGGLGGVDSPYEEPVAVDSSATEQQSSNEEYAFDLDDLMSTDAQQITTGRLHQEKKVSKKKK